MRVLLIKGEGLDGPISALKKRFKESVEIVTINYLDNLEKFYSQGYVFDKCIVLTPKRVIQDYTVEMLESNLLAFKEMIELHSTGTLQEIIFCVSTEEEGCIVAENTCDLAGMFFAIKLEKMAVGDLNNFITQQGTALAQKYQSYDLTTLKMLEMKKQQELKAGAFKETDSTPEESTGGFDSLDSFPSDEESLVGGVGGLEQDTTESKEVYQQLDIADTFWGDGQDIAADTNKEPNDFFNSNTSSEGGFFDTDDEADEDSADDFFGTPSLTQDTGGFFDTDTETADGFLSKETSEGFFDSEQATESFFDTEEEPDNSAEGFFDTGEAEKIDSSVESFFDTEPQENTDFGGFEEDTKQGSLADSDTIIEPTIPTAHTKTKLRRKDAKQDTTVTASLADTVVKEETPKKKGLFGRKKESTPVKTPAQPTAPKPVQQATVPTSKSKLRRKTTQEHIAPEAEELETRVTDMEQHKVQRDTYDTLSSGVVLEDDSSADYTDMDASQLFEDTDSGLEKGRGTGIKDKKSSNQNISAKDKAIKKSALNTELKAKLDVYRSRGALMVFTGSPNTGKTLISGNIANLLCRMGYSTVLIDLDTLYKGQSYLNFDCCQMIHSSKATKQNVVSALNSTGTDFSRYLDVVRPGFHMLTTTLGSDAMRPDLLIHNKSFARLIRELIAAYNFVIVDVGFQDLINTYRDFVDSADSLVFVEDATTHGMTSFMLNLANVEEEVIQATLFRRGSLILNKEDGMDNFFGRKVNDTLTLLSSIDELVTSLQGAEAEFKFTDIQVAGVLQYNKSFEPFWNNKKFVSDTAEGEKLFLNLLQNCL